ncbi:MAG: GerAB/ArcD/ProY family transporter [Oscillospiraceae bacterium]|nr:GerAB/ArcD/ProY family transporter [Oscillospiraceae bacterium]
MNTRISRFQLAGLLGVSAMFTETANLPEANSYDMWRFVSLLCTSAALLLLYLPMMVYSSKNGETGMLRVITEKNRFIGWVFGIIIMLRLLYTAVLTFVQLEFFVTNTIMAYLSSAYITVIVFAAALYGINKGIQATARLAPLALIILLLFIITVSIASWSSMSLLRLHSPIIHMRTGEFTLIKNDEIILFAIMLGLVRNKNNKGNAYKSVLLYLPIVLVMSLWLNFIFNTILGRFLERTLYPLYTLSSFTYLALFERMDGIDVTVVIVMGLLKLIMTFVCVRIIISDLLFNNVKAEKAGRITASSLLILTGLSGYFLLARREWLLSPSLNIYFLVITITIAVIMPCTAALINSRRSKNEIKSTSDNI